MSEIKIFIDNKMVPNEVIKEWELSRLKREYRFLFKKGVVFSNHFEDLLNKGDVSAARAEMGDAKAAYEPEKFRKMLHKRVVLGNFLSRMAALISHGKRKFSVTELAVSDSDLSPEEVMAGIEEIMLINTPEHLALNLATTPDHFVLISPRQKVQEVLEITGGSPLPNQFFAHYGDETGLQSNFGSGFQVQAAGAARLSDGTVIGGVRHQIKREGRGFRFRALVEFPSVLPDYMIRKHEIHLACEFSNWITAIL